MTHPLPQHETQHTRPPDRGRLPPARWWAAAAALALAACGAGGGGELPEAGESPQAAAPPCTDIAPQARIAVVAGVAAFESMPHLPNGGLDPARTLRKPIRGATAQLVDAAGRVLSACVTTDAGGYFLAAPDGAGPVRLRVRAELLQTEGADGQWNVTVRDNTRGGALYVLDSALFTPVTASLEVRDVLAGSGFGGTGYTGPRLAAPFAILDVVFEATRKVAGVAPGTTFPPLQLFWSVNNRPVDGAREDGAILRSFHEFDPEQGHRMFLLGQENVDTDEYDGHVIAREWGRYFQAVFSRNDSIGGEHAFGERLDLRVAFTEGWCNAWAAMVLEDPVFADSRGELQAGGTSFDVSQPPPEDDRGWYSEASIQFLLWSFRQDPGIGLAPVLDTMAVTLPRTPARAGIHAFSVLLKERVPEAAQAINGLLQAMRISSQDGDLFASAETNDGGIPQALPIYRSLADGPHCVSDVAGSFNKLGNRVFVRFDNTPAGPRRLRLAPVAGQFGTDPDFLLAVEVVEAVLDSAVPDEEVADLELREAPYTAELLDFNLLADPDTNGVRCFDFSVE
jgi:hypothetical protein